VADCLGILLRCFGSFQEENLRAALLLEQAALCLLRITPPHVRKFAFHMVLAGLRYNACNQQQLGIRAYR
jgi:trafficking protein particle complex subunit 8